MAAKVSFDTTTRIITITQAPVLENGDWVVDIDVKVDLYSDGKEDWLASETLRKLVYPISSVGGNPTVGLNKLGSTFFLASDWKIAPYEASHRLRVNGNFYSVDGTSPFNITAGTYNIFLEQTVSNLTDSTIQQLAEIEYGTFNGGVTVDVNSPYSGDTYPVGSPSAPVNNIADALLIDNGRFGKILLASNITFDADAILDDFVIEGQSHVNTNVIINPAASVVNTTFVNLHIQGTLDGGNSIDDCSVGDITYVNGHIHNCGIHSTITLGGNADANIVNCKQLDMLNNPIIDMGGSGQSLVMPNFTGLAELYNSTGADNKVGVGLDGGRVILDTTTFTHGFVHVSGIGLLVDELGTEIPTGTWNTNVIIINELLSNDTITRAVWNANVVDDHIIANSAGLILNRTRNIERRVFVDTEELTNGDGTAGSPFNNIGDAIDFAEANSIKQLVVFAEITLDRNLKNFTIIGVGAPVINTNGQDLKNSEFSHCVMRGTYVDRIIVQESVLDDGFALNGFFEKCALNGDLTCVDSSNVLLANCFSNIPGLGRPTVSMNGIGSSALSIRSYSGGLTIKDCNNVADAVTIEMSQGKLTLDSTCTAGVISIRGISQFTDNSSITPDVSGLISKSIEDLLKFENNRWKIEANQLIIYDDDGTTAIRTFDLKDAAGNPTSDSPYERVPV